MPRWQYITAIDISTEVILFTFSFALVHKLQMAWKNKFVIVLSFASRLPYALLLHTTASNSLTLQITNRLIVFQSLRLAKYHTYVQSRDPTFTAIDHFVWTQVELYYSLISCTVFCLRPFMDAVTTHYGTAGDISLGSSSRTQHQSNLDVSSRSREGYALHTLGKDQMARKGDLLFPNGVSRAEANTLSPRGGGASSDHEEGNSVWSVESSRMLIRKDVEISVSHTPRGHGD